MKWINVLSVGQEFFFTISFVCVVFNHHVITFAWHCAILIMRYSLNTDESISTSISNRSSSFSWLKPRPRSIPTTFIVFFLKYCILCTLNLACWENLNHWNEYQQCEMLYSHAILLRDEGVRSRSKELQGNGRNMLWSA